ncbi:hypothetical protein JCM30760_16110 [Thiomicrorhabdus hydrogeniphila]
MQQDELTLNQIFEKVLNGEEVKFSEDVLSLLYKAEIFKPGLDDELQGEFITEHITELNVKSSPSSISNSSLTHKSVVDESSEYWTSRIKSKCTEMLDIPCYVTKSIH